MKRKFAITLLLIAVSLLTLGCEKKPEQLMFPENIQVNDRILTWDPVENASSYTVTIGDQIFRTQECRMELHALTMKGGSYNIEVVACNDSKEYADSSRARVTIEIEAPIAHGFDEQGYEFVFIESLAGYEINRGTAELSGEVVLPDEYEGYPVKKIADKMFMNSLDSHSWPSCFGEYNCNKTVTAVRLPSRLEIIGKYSFAYMVRLDEIVIPDSVTSIGASAFEGCTHLTKVEFSQDLKYILARAFQNTALKDVDFPESLEMIEACAFKNEYPIKDYQNGVLVDEVHIYSDLSSIYIPASVKQIGEEAFWGRENLQEITFGNAGNIEMFDEKVFEDTKWYLDQPDGIVWLGDLLYAYKGKLPADSTVEIPSNAIVCGGAFLEQTKLKKVVIHTGAKLVGQKIFRNCNSLLEVVIHEGLQRIPAYTFQTTDSLACITFPDGISEIGYAALSSAGLRKVVLPASLEKMSGFALFGTSVPFTHIFCKGTPEQVEGYDCMPSNKDIYYFYSETKPTEPGNYWRYVDGVPTPWEEEE